MFDRLAQIEARWKELNEALASPEIANDSALYQKTAKAQGELAPIVEKYQEYKKLQGGISDSRAMLEGETDPDMLAYAREELGLLEQQLSAVEEELKFLLLPKDPNDEKNIILEIRAGTGGMRRRFLPRKFSACICATPNPAIGKLKFSPVRIPPSAASRRSSRSSKASASTLN